MANPLKLTPVAFCMLAIMALPVCIILIRDPLNIFLIPVVFAAPAVTIYVCWWKKARQHTTLDWITRMFFTGACPGVCCALIVELILQVIFAIIVFGGDKDALEAAGDAQSTDPEKQQQALDALRHSARFYVFLLLMAFVVAATVEESVKLAAVRVAPLWRCVCREWDLRVANPYATLLFIVAAAMGFSTMENLEYTFAADFSAEPLAFGVKVLLAIVRVFVSFPVHAICGGLTGVRLIQREFSPSPGLLPAVLLPAITLHGTFDAIAMIVPVMMTDAVAATLVSGCCCILLVIVGGVVLRRQLRALDLPDKYNQYLNRVQQGIYAVHTPGGVSQQGMQMGAVQGYPQQGYPSAQPGAHFMYAPNPATGGAPGQVVQGVPVQGYPAPMQAQWTTVGGQTAASVHTAGPVGTVAQPPPPSQGPATGQ